MPSPRILFDTNAVRSFFRERGVLAAALPELRQRTRLAAATGSLRAVGTEPVIWELTSLVEEEGRAHYVDVIRFYVGLAHQWWMLNEYGRMRLELRRRRPLADNEVFTVQDQDKVLGRCLNQTWIEETYKRRRADKDAERSDEHSIREEAVRALDEASPDWRALLTDEMSPEQFEKAVATRVRLEMKREARREGLRPAGHQWPLPRRVPTFWFSESFTLAKALRVFAGKKGVLSKSSIDATPDMLDATHFRDAAYVDVFVTNDANLRDVAAGARVPIRVVTLEEFATELGLRV
jgi:hypothetical protein